MRSTFTFPGTAKSDGSASAEALGWLAHPEDVIALLNGTYDQEPAPAEKTSTRQRAVLHVHLSQAAVAGLTGAVAVARVEQLGPQLLEQVARLLGHARVEVKPVIDLNTGRSVNGYEFPPDITERAHLRTTGDVFPHATSQSRRLDSDHPVPYDAGHDIRGGPPGQTGDHNIAPLGRRHHRAKTHLAYQVHQLAPGRYLWHTPHGLWRLVDPTGTHTIDDWTAQRLMGSITA